MLLKGQSVKKKQAINRYYSIASIQSLKESSNYNKIVYFAGEALEKSNISANIRKKSKAFLGLLTGTRRSCLKKKTRGEKSRGTVPLRTLFWNCFSLIFLLSELSYHTILWILIEKIGYRLQNLVAGGIT
jgi:hypothetical protein